MIGKLKKDSAAYTHQCSGEGREKREGKSLCGGNHITSLLYLREERKKVLTHSCKGILHLHRYVYNASYKLGSESTFFCTPLTLLMNSNLTKPEQLLEPRVPFKSIKMSSRPLVISILIKIRSSTTCKCLQILLAEASDGYDAFTGVLHRDPVSK